MVRGDEVLGEGLHVGLGLHLLDIGPGGKGLLRSGDDHASDTGVFFGNVQGIAELFHESTVQRIQRLRTVQRDQPNGTTRLVLDGLVAHGHTLQCLPRGLPHASGSHKRQRITHDAGRTIQRWQLAQKKVERPDCTMRLIVRLHPAREQRSPARS